MDFVIPKYSTKIFTDIYSNEDLFKADYGKYLPKTITDDNYGILYYLLYGKYGNNPIANNDEEQFKVKLQSIIWQYGPVWEKKLDIQKILRELQETDLLKGTYNDFTSDNTSKITNSNTSETNTTDNSDSTITSNKDSLQSHAVGPGELGSVIDQDNGKLLNYVNDQVATKGNENITSNTENTGSANTTQSGTSDVTDNKTSSQKITKSKMDAYEQLWRLLDADATNEFITRFSILFKTVVRAENPILYYDEY